MRAVSEQYGIPEAAVQAVIAGTDLLCLGRDQNQHSFLAVKAALLAAVRSGRLPGERLEEAAARVAELRAWTLGGGQGRGHGPRSASGLGPRPARSAWRQPGGPSPSPAPCRRLRRPLVVQLVPPSNLAAGAVPWGLSPFVPADSYREISTGTPAGRPG